MTNDNEKNKGTTRAIKTNILMSGKMILMDGMKHIRTGKIQKYLKH